MRRRDFLGFGIAAAWMARSMPWAHAQDRYPNRPVRLVIPSVPAGVHDVIGRLWAEKVKPILGTIVVVLSVVYGLTFLPAALAILGPRVNALSLPVVRPEQLDSGPGFWPRLATLVMAYPWRVFLPVA